MFKSKTHANEAAKKMLRTLPGKWKLKFTYDYIGRFARRKKCYFEVTRGNVRIHQYNQRYFYVSIRVDDQAHFDKTYYGASGLTLKTAMAAAFQKVNNAYNKTKQASNKIERLIEQVNEHNGR